MSNFSARGLISVDRDYKSVIITFSSEEDFHNAKIEAEDAGIVTEVSGLYASHSFFCVGDVTFEPPLCLDGQLLREAGSAAREM